MTVAGNTNSAPCLVLLPGLDGTGRMFAPFVDRCPQNLDVVVVSYPGERQLGYDELLDLVCDQLPEGRPFFLLGESFSGPLAVRAAAMQPAGLCGVILCATFVTSPTPWYIRWWPALFSASMVRFLVKMEGLATQWLLGRCRRELKAFNQDSRREVCPEVIAHRVRSTMTVDVREELQTLSVPLMYLAAKWDLVIPKRSRQQIQRLRPDLDLRVVDGPHALLQTRPDMAWSEIRGWLEQLNAPPATIPITAEVPQRLPQTAVVSAS